MATRAPQTEASSHRFETTEAEGVSLHFLTWGEEGSPLLVLLHGGGANAHWWDHIAPTFARDFYVTALDFRGHGDSDYPDETRVGAFSDDLEALLAHLAARRGLGRSADLPVVLMGHSMGGGIAVDHAARHSEVRGLVAVDVSRGAARRSRRAARLALALRRSYETREEAVARYRFLPTSDHASESLRVHIAGHSVRREPDGRYGFKFDPRWFSLPARPRPEIGRIRCPVLLVRGSESPMLTEEGARELVSELPDGRVLLVEGAGHHVHLDQPERFLAGVAPFLASIG
jgi:pimeloyl-ACP methyl ester carboxylesterase